MLLLLLLFCFYIDTISRRRFLEALCVCLCVRECCTRRWEFDVVTFSSRVEEGEQVFEFFGCQADIFEIL